MAWNLTYDYTAGTGLISNVFDGRTLIFAQSWIIPLLIIVISLFLITRDTEKWKMLALPVAVGWSIIGIKVNYIILLATAIMFVVEGLSLTVVGNWLGVNRMRKEKQRKEIRDIRETLRNIGKQQPERSKYTQDVGTDKQWFRSLPFIGK